MSNQVSEVSNQEVLRPKVCPVCDYSLAGLPAEGICPECGTGYDTSRVYLYGEAMGTRRRAWNARAQRPGQMVFGGILILVLATVNFWPRRHGRFQQPINLFYFGWFAVIYLFSVWRSLTDQGSGVVQVKLTPVGVRQGTRGLGPMPYERNEQGKVVPWRSVKFIRLARHGQFGEILINNQHGSWWTHLTRDYVHARFICSEEEFVALQKRLREWLDRIDSGAEMRIV